MNENKPATDKPEVKPEPTMRERLAEIRHRQKINAARVRRGQAPLGADWMPVQ